MLTAPLFHCRLCGGLLHGGGLSLERIPVCNRFTATREPAERHDLRLDQCARCQLIQLCEALPVDAVMPRLPWIKYREPEGHLDSVVDRLLSGPCAKAGSSFGVGPFDQPLLHRLEQRGLSSSALETRPSQSGDGKRFPYLESWQLGLNAATLAEVAHAHGQADIVSCRYLLEHCDDPLGALRGLRQLLSADGVLIVEVPDSTKFLTARDYSFIWEEHISYFVESTFRLLAAKAGYAVVELHRYSGQLEDALIAVLRPSTNEAGADLAQTCLSHQAVMFVNAFDLSQYVAAAVDDDASKSGYFPPGFRVPVIPSQALLQDTRIRACLFAVAPGIVHKVRDKLAPLAERGVQFRSIFAGVPGSLLSGQSSWH